MSSLKDIREAQIRIDMTIGPIEESYALLNRFELYFDDGNSERIDGLAYQWKNLMAQVSPVLHKISVSALSRLNVKTFERKDTHTYLLLYLCLQREAVDELSFIPVHCLQVNHVQNTLLEVQPGFKSALLNGVEKFQADVNVFYKDYDSK